MYVLMHAAERSRVLRLPFSSATWRLAAVVWLCDTSSTMPMLMAVKRTRTDSTAVIEPTHTDRIAALERTHTDRTAALQRTCIDRTAALKRTHTDRTAAVKRTHIDRTAAAGTPPERPQTGCPRCILHAHRSSPAKQV